MEKKLRRAKRQLRRFNQKLVQAFKKDAFYNTLPPKKPKAIDPTKSNKERLIERRIKAGRLGKVR